MAEESTDPDPANDLGRRITEYFNSPEAKEHFLQGASQADTPFLSLQDFKKRESGRFSKSLSQGSVPEGNEVSKALKKKQERFESLNRAFSKPKPKVTYTTAKKVTKECHLYGHLWRPTADSFVEVCERCGTETLLRNAVEDFLADEDEEQATRTCIWCGEVCASVEALDLHEADCEP